MGFLFAILGACIFRVLLLEIRARRYSAVILKQQETLVIQHELIQLNMQLDAQKDTIINEQYEQIKTRGALLHKILADGRPDHKPNTDEDKNRNN